MNGEVNIISLYPADVILNAYAHVVPCSIIVMT